jgi:hypothetical protein
MKKIFITTAIAALFSASVFAADGGKKTNETTVNVSYAVVQSFNSDFATAKDIVWTVTKNCQKADFYVDGVKRTAFYKLSGEFLGTTQTVGYSAIPEKSQKAIAANYKGYVAGDVIVYQTNEELNDTIDATTYFVDLKSSSHEVLVRVTNGGGVEFFKQVK